MSGLYYLNVTVHVLAAMLWLGGMFFLAAVGAPVLRGLEPGVRAQVFRRLGERFRGVGWGAIGVLIVTGVLNLHFRGWLCARVLGDRAFWGTALGHALAWKLSAVTVMLGVSSVHDFVLGPAASRLPAGDPRAARMRTLAGWGARVNAVVGIVLVAAAVRLARGG
jgi:putative copper resistance protein D